VGFTAYVVEFLLEVSFKFNKKLLTCPVSTLKISDYTFNILRYDYQMIEVRYIFCLADKFGESYAAEVVASVRNIDLYGGVKIFSNFICPGYPQQVSGCSNQIKKFIFIGLLYFTGS